MVRRFVPDGLRSSSRSSSDGREASLDRPSRHDRQLVAYPVGTPSRLIGVVHYEQLVHAVESGRLSDPVSELVDDELVHVHPDHVSDVVLQRLASSSGLLPVVTRDDAQRLVGVVTFDGVRRFLRERRPS